MLQATNTNVIAKWAEEKKLRSGTLILSREPYRHTRWAEAVTVGQLSMLRPGDELLLSARPTAYYFSYEGDLLMNTSDAATLAYRRDGVLGATCGTVIYEWLEPVEETTASGIVVVRKESTKEMETRWALVHAAGPDSGVKAGDHILLAYDKDCYSIENIIDGKKLHNAGKEAIVCFVQAPV